MIGVLLSFAREARGGPPYVLDDPEPTDYCHLEIYAFNAGTAVHCGTDIEAGVDFNYGAARNLQLTAVIPEAFLGSAASAFRVGLGNIELAAKCRFLHEEDVGCDVGTSPGCFSRPRSRRGRGSMSRSSFRWLKKHWHVWTAFGVGGCEVNGRGDSRDLCIGGAVLGRRLPSFPQAGVEVYHRSPNVKGGSRPPAWATSATASSTPTRPTS